jgi:acyl dehydratase
MAIDPERLLAHRFPEIRHRYVERDAILYALGIGLGADPLDQDDLAYLIETKLSVLPTMAVTLASPGMWVRDPALGIDWVRLVHAEQAATFHAALPPSAEVISAARVASLADRGEGKGAVLVLEREIRDAQSAIHYCTLRQTLLLRGDGGYGGPPPAPTAVASPPARAADYRLSALISPRAALIYRLSGDWNPLHADPAVARKAGFDRPILHGLASYGIAGRAVTKAAGVRLGSLAVRFAGVVYPGDTLEFTVWREAGKIFFEGHVGDRRVLDRAYAETE